MRILAFFFKLYGTAVSFNVVIGVNNSGKTSILQSIIFGHYLLRKCFWIEKNKAMSGNRTDYTFDLIPNMFLKDLWYNQKTRGRGNISIPIRISLNYENGLSFEFETHYRYGGLNHKVSQAPDKLLVKHLEEILKNVPLFIPASTGIVVREEYRASGVRDFLISSGRSAELIRSYLHDISKGEHGRSEEIQFIKTKLKNIFGTTDLRVEWNEATDTHMKAFYSEKGNQLDLLSGGSGFIQFIQVLSKIWYRQSSLILLDEPDAHLNPNLVYDMVHTLREYEKRVGVQIVIATHSRDVLDILEPEHILIIDANQKESKSCAEGKEAAYDAIGIHIPVKELALLQMFNKILLVEGSSDQTLLNKFGNISDSNFVSYLRDTFILPIKGKDNFDAYINFFNSLEQRLSKNIDIFFLRDRDDLPDNEYQTKLNYYNSKVKSASITKRNELESYLIVPTLWVKVLSKKEISFTENDFEELVSAIKSEMEIELETKFERSYAKLKDQAIGNEITRSEAKKVFRKMMVDEPYALLPGKEVLKKICNRIQDKYNKKVSIPELLDNMEASHLSDDMPQLLKSILEFTGKIKPSLKRRR